MTVSITSDAITKYIVDITRWREDIDFMCEWQELENIK